MFERHFTTKHNRHEHGQADADRQERAAQTPADCRQTAMVHMSPIELSNMRSSGSGLTALAADDNATTGYGPKKAAATGGPMKRRKRRTANGAAPVETMTYERDGDATRLNASAAAGASSEEEKKEKNRNSVRRSYYRKIETLGELRVHADNLRQQYNEMLQRWEGRFFAVGASDEAESSFKLESAAKNEDSSKSELLLRYMELSRLRDELWMENQQLQGAFDDREKGAFRLQRLFDVNYQLMDHSAHASSKNPETVRFPSPVLIMDEMSFDAFSGFSQGALRQVEGFLAKKQEMTAKNQVLGWKSSHIVEEDAFRFYFEKQFTLNPSATCARDVAAQAWETLTSPEKHSELYARTLHVRFHVMQIFDANSYVLYRTMEKEGEDSITTALIVMTRIPRGNNGGCLIICKGLKKTEHKLHMESMSEYTLHKKKIWRESMYWLSIEETTDQDEDFDENPSALETNNGETSGPQLRVAHGGIMNNMGDRSPSFWLFENLLIALRWESKLGLVTKTTPPEPLSTSSLAP